MNRLFSLLVLIFTAFVSSFSASAQEEPTVTETAVHEEATEGKSLDIKKIIFEHVGDAHEWHFMTIGHTHVSVPLPVILYSPEKGVSMFSASSFGHEGERVAHDGYRIVDEHYKEEMIAAGKPAEEVEGIKEGTIVSEDGSKVYDFSITKNVMSMLISVVLLLWIMLSVAKKYKAREGQAPTGFQNAIEPVITFVRDEVAVPNLGHKANRFMPLLLTFFFFIWINNMLGLIPGGANFTGNVAVTACLALISFIVMVVRANGHFWGHLLNPPGVPLPIKFILVPIEIISLFIKPVALTIRLFANILAGHIIILSIVCMIFIFGAMSPVAGWGFSPVSVGFSIFMFFLELLVAAIQAFIFTTLTAVFIGQAVDEGHGHEDGQHYHTSENEIIA
ncbi:F0F1 ATP synthase subunit A [Rurimicrobium arvi]|uniref:ATP synthase subunit a n=1 Tax=Rurimicrobium arvi TaxID=2049916 RepID=A0ABP8MNM8_9BACT